MNLSDLSVPPDFDANETLREMALHTETATAVVLASRVEDWLAAAIETRMREPLSSRLKERLYHGYGPLNSFSAKIDIAYAFSLIDDEIYNDLRAIKDIRNVFAHSKAVLNFNSPELKPHIQKLTGWSAKRKPDHPLYGPVQGLR